MKTKHRIHLVIEVEDPLPMTPVGNWATEDLKDVLACTRWTLESVKVEATPRPPGNYWTLRYVSADWHASWWDGESWYCVGERNPLQSRDFIKIGDRVEIESERR